MVAAIFTCIVQKIKQTEQRTREVEHSSSSFAKKIPRSLSPVFAHKEQNGPFLWSLQIWKTRQTFYKEHTMRFQQATEKWWRNPPPEEVELTVWGKNFLLLWTISHGRMPWNISTWACRAAVLVLPGRDNIARKAARC